MRKINDLLYLARWYFDLLIVKIKYPREGKHTQMCLAAGYELKDIDEQVKFIEDWYGFEEGVSPEEMRDVHCEVEISYWDE